ncbi:MAG: hypothetical protein ACI9G1_003352, partial [Pirellulaceae bacterium]
MLDSHLFIVSVYISEFVEWLQSRIRCGRQHGVGIQCDELWITANLLIIAEPAIVGIVGCDKTSSRDQIADCSHYFVARLEFSASPLQSYFVRSRIGEEVAELPHFDFTSRRLTQPMPQHPNIQEGLQLASLLKWTLLAERVAGPRFVIPNIAKS